MVLVSLKIAGNLNHKDKTIMVNLKNNEHSTIKEYLDKNYPYAVGYKII